MTTPAMQRIELDVFLDDEDNPTHHRVRVLSKDMIVAEREMARRGLLVKTNPIEASHFFAWASLRRSGHGVGEYDEFLQRVVDLNDVKDEAPGVDPTRPALGTASA